MRMLVRGFHPQAVSNLKHVSQSKGTLLPYVLLCLTHLVHLCLTGIGNISTVQCLLLDQSVISLLAKWLQSFAGGAGVQTSSDTISLLESMASLQVRSRATCE